jgi:hypothetical protein
LADRSTCWAQRGKPGTIWRGIVARCETGPRQILSGDTDRHDLARDRRDV